MANFLFSAVIYYFVQPLYIVSIFYDTRNFNGDIGKLGENLIDTK